MVPDVSRTSRTTFSRAMEIQYKVSHVGCRMSGSALSCNLLRLNSAQKYITISNWIVLERDVPELFCTRGQQTVRFTIRRASGAGRFEF
jgi:hypothetical protein